MPSVDRGTSLCSDMVVLKGFRSWSCMLQMRRHEFVNAAVVVFHDSGFHK